jgi:predicted esterase
MRRRTSTAALALSALLPLASGAAGQGLPPAPAIDYSLELQHTLEQLAAESDVDLLRLHWESIAQVVRTADPESPRDAANLQRLYEAFLDTSDADSPLRVESYLDRRRPLIISWVSAMDGEVSFAWLTLPAAWDPDRAYPLYVQLHGLWDVASTRLEYLAHPFSNVGSSFAFDDGYAVAPWGRGNQWYRGLAEGDVWECLDVVEQVVRVDESRQYLTGHSMGGYGAWHLAQRTPGRWAALGVHAGALWYDGSELRIDSVARLRDVPTYFVVGDLDPLFDVNLFAARLLVSVGNPQVVFVTFPGGHDHHQEDVEQMYLWLRGFPLHSAE